MSRTTGTGAGYMRTPQSIAPARRTLTLSQPLLSPTSHLLQIRAPRPRHIRAILAISTDPCVRHPLSEAGHLRLTPLHPVGSARHLEGEWRSNYATSPCPLPFQTVASSSAKCTRAPPAPPTSRLLVATLRSARLLPCRAVVVVGTPLHVAVVVAYRLVLSQTRLRNLVLRV